MATNRAERNLDFPHSPVAFERRVTAIQKLLGHQRLSSTMIYARVYDRAVAEDYHAVMEVVGKRLDIIPLQEEENADSQ